MAKIIIAKNFSDARGSLTVTDERELGFSVKRIFNIYNLKPNSERGGHGHKKSVMAMSCPTGSCEIYINDGEKISTFKLDNPTQFIVLQPHEWHKMYDFAEGTSIQVLASEFYSPDDYFYEEPKLK